MEQIRIGELDGVEDLMPEINDRAHGFRRRISMRATDSSVDFIQHLKDILKISVPFETPNLLLIEWEKDIWQQLAKILQEIGDEIIPEVPKDIRGVLKNCLTQSSLAPLQESRNRTISDKQRRIRELERRLDQHNLAFKFTPHPRENGASGENNPSAATSPPGEGGSGLSAGVSRDQAVCGRVAELFVMHACWVRFLGCEANGRGQILDAVIARREHGSGERDDHVRWSTKTASRDLEDRLARQRDDLLTCPQDAAEVPDDLAKRYRIVLSTNEFHRASRDSESYVLRLIAVPRAPEANLDQVRWVCDIPNPVHNLGLREQIWQGIRGGTLPLKLQMDWG